MGIAKNPSGTFMPHAESRKITPAVLGTLNAETILTLDGDNSVSIYLDSLGNAANATYTTEGTVDGTNWFSLLAFSYPPAAAGGAIPSAGQPIISETVTVATKRLLHVSSGGLKQIKVRLSAYTSGALTVNMIADTCDSLSPYVRDQKVATLFVTSTGVASAAVTATLPSVLGLRHYIDRISVVRSMTVAQTALSTPTVVTSTNIPGSPAWTIGTDAAAMGTDREVVQEFGGAGMAATATATATTIVAPAISGAIWRINVAYRLGL